MQLHTLTRKNKNKKARQVGRGGTRGKTSGKGTKGQNSRAGRKKRPEIRDVIKRLPKMRGRGVNSNKSIKNKPFPINLSTLSVYKAGETVSPVTLSEKGITRKSVRKVKILGTGDIAIKLDFVQCLVSESAKIKIEAAGGSIN